MSKRAAESMDVDKGKAVDSDSAISAVILPVATCWETSIGHTGNCPASVPAAASERDVSPYWLQYVLLACNGSRPARPSATAGGMLQVCNAMRSSK